MYQAKYLETVKVRRTGRWVQVVKQGTLTSLTCTKMSEHSRAKQGYSTYLYKTHTDTHSNSRNHTTEIRKIRDRPTSIIKSHITV